MRGRDSDGHLFWDCIFPPLVETREHPEFHDLIEMDKTSCPRCLLWHGWLLLLSGINGDSPWAQTPAEGAVNLLECALGRYSSGQLSEWRLPAGFDVEGAAQRVADEPDVWTDGSLVDDKDSGVSSAGAGCFTFRVRRLWACWNWGHWDDDVGDGSVVSACRGFLSVPGPLQTVQRAELWGVILALQAGDGIHLGVDNLGVVRHVGRILDGKLPSRPFELLPDGDLLFLIDRMLRIRGLGSVRISKVKGHAVEAMVRTGTVRGLDKLGNDGADEAAEFGRRRVPWWIIDARRNLSGVCSRWRPLVLVLHRFFIAISRAVVNHGDGAGTDLDPLVWSSGSALKRRRVAVRNRVFLPGPPDLWVGSWVSVAATPISCRDIEVWPFSVGMLVKWVSFLSSLHWPAGECDLGVGGVSNVELLILYELWAGERLQLEKAVPRYRRPGRSISVSAVPFGPGTDIWRSCKFLGALFRGLRDLPFGLRRLVPCDNGANHCRLRHIGWERCGRGLTSRPRESSPVDFLDRLLVLFGYPDRYAAAFLAGDLPLWYCSARFAWKLPTWRLPDRGRVRELVTESVDGARVIGSDGVGGDLFPPSVGRAGGSFGNRVLGCFKTIRLNRKTPAHLARVGNCMNSKSRSRVWKRLRVSGVHWCSVCDSHVLHECHHGGAGVFFGLQGWGWIV